MAIVYGKAGENAFSKGLEKQLNTLLSIVIGCSVLFALVGFLCGLGFSGRSTLQLLSLAGLLLLVFTIIILQRKIDKLLETRFRGARAWRRGAEGERVIAELLESDLPDDYFVFNDVRFPGRMANIDHIVIGPSGIYTINTKNWRGIVKWSEDGNTLMWNGEPEKKRTAEAAQADALDVHDKLRVLMNRDFFVKPILVFPMAKVVPKLDASVELQQDDYLIEKRLKYIDKRNALSEKDVKGIVNAMTALFRESI